MSSKGSFSRKLHVFFIVKFIIVSYNIITINFLELPMHITALCLSATLQRTATFNKVQINEVNRSTHFRLDASGKAVNVARVLNQLQNDCSSVICPIGKENKDIFMNLSNVDKLNVKPILIPGFTRECITIIETNHKNVTELVMDEPVLEDEASIAEISNAEKELLNTIRESIQTSNTLVFAGSRPKIWAENLNSTICKEAVEKGLTVLVDFWGKDLLSVLDVCTPEIIKINAKEFCGTFDLLCENNEKKLIQEICKKSEELQNCIVITRGKDTTLASYKGKPYFQAIENVEVVNSIGCGDSFSAGFLYEYMIAKTKRADIDIQKALLKGTWCAARNAAVEKVGSIV